MNQSLPLFFGLITTPLELISFILSIITVALNIRQLHWAWLFSILSSGLYALVFLDARLYGDMGLQFAFILTSIWGWHLWLWGDRDHDKGKNVLSVSRLTMKGSVNSLLGWIVGFVILAWFLKFYTDTDVPIADGFFGLQSIRKNSNDIQVVMLTVFESDEHIFEAIKLGANGYLLKTTSPAKIVESILSVHEGGVPMTASIARKVLTFMSQKNVQLAAGGEPH